VELIADKFGYRQAGLRAGARTPTEAAQALGLSLPRYYLLEERALQGMLVACEPRSMSRGPSGRAPSALEPAKCQRP